MLEDDIYTHPRHGFNVAHGDSTRGVAGIDDKSLAETMGVIEDRASNSAAVTLYKKIAANNKCLQSTGKCKKCSKTFKNKKVCSKQGQDDKVTMFEMCLDCYKKENPS